MNFRNWRLRTKLGALIVLFFIAIAGTACYSILVQRADLMAARQQSVKSEVESALGILAYFHGQEVAGKMSEADARAAAYETIKTMRYDGNNYFTVFDAKTRAVSMHPFHPEMVGLTPEQRDPKDAAITIGIVNAALKDEAGGFASYRYPRPGAPKDAPPVPKIAFAKVYAPWNAIVSTGLYVDDVDAVVVQHALVFGGAALVVMLLIGAVSFVLSRSITRPLARALEVAGHIAAGQLDGTIDDVGHDETGQLLAAMKAMQSSIQRLVAAQQDMARQHQAGVIDYRIPTAEFPGTYGTMAASTNDLVAAHLAVIERVVGIVQSYAQGDFSPEMEALPGQKAQVTAAIRGVKASFVAISEEVTALAEAAARGDFARRGDATRFSHAFRTMVAELNRLMETCDSSLGDLARVLGAIAAGDLTEEIERDYQGTFGVLKNDANATVSQLHRIVTDIRGASESINAAAREIASGNADLSGRTEQQAASLEETASSMEELTSTVRQNAENARQANQLAVAASEVASKGGAVVAEVVTTMSAIAESSSKISDIIGVIDGIAFQTNILALNAAVEAARAGEQGRGFAVVASEVRTLAQRSASAAKEIKDLIGDSVAKVESGARLVDDAGTTMKEIVGSVRRVTDIMAEITAASAEQSSGIEQVNQAVNQMDQTTQQNAALVEEAAAAAQAMEDQAGSLSRSVALFKLERKAAAVRVGEAPAPAQAFVERRGPDRPKNVTRLPAVRR